MALPVCSRRFSAESGRLLSLRFKYPSGHVVGLSTFSTSKSALKKAGMVFLGASAGVAAVTAYCLDMSVKASAQGLHPPAFPWSHNGFLQSMDHGSIRRGYQVYKQVCASCHSMRYLCYRHMVDVCMTEEEAKAEAASIMVEDGPDDDGNMFQRPGKLSDKFPRPYKNDKSARAANNGALPPDLNLIVQARHGGEDYLYSLLTGYQDPPAGHTVPEGQYYNPYFPGGNISMAQALYSEIIDYDDGTPATQSQLAKDVTTFLKWAGQMEHDVQRLIFIKGSVVFAALFFITLYMKRHAWSSLKTRKLVFLPKKGPKI